MSYYGDPWQDLLRLLGEAPYSGWVGALGRPDADYNGAAYTGLRRDSTLGGKGFPYDRDRDEDPFEIGRDMHSGDREEDRTDELTPQDRGRTARSGFEEAAGTPVNQTIGSRGGAQTGNPAGGMGGSWANNPIRTWDEDDEDRDQQLAVYGESQDPEDAPFDQDFPAPEGEDYDFTTFPSFIAQVAGSGFGSGLGRANPSGRGFANGWTEDHDLLTAESAWAALARLTAR